MNLILSKILNQFKNTALLSLCGLCIYLGFFKKLDIPEGQVLVNESWIDSINDIANSKPDTIIKYIYKDTIFYHVDTIFPEVQNDSTFIYQDSVKTKEIDIYSTNILHTDNLRLDTRIKYNLKVPVIIEKQIIKEVPVIQTVTNTVYKRYNAVFLSSSIVYQNHEIMPVIALKMQNKGILYGIGYGRLCNENIFQGEIGIQLFKFK